jgi:hypothetical protein
VLVTRRLAAFALSAAVIVGASACSTVDPPAASIGPIEISASDLRRELDEVAKAKVPLGQDGLDPSLALPASVPASFTRSWLTLRVQFEIFHQVAADNGIVPTEEQIATEAERLSTVMVQDGVAGNPWELLSERTRTYLATRQAEISAITGADNVDDLRVQAVELAQRVRIDPRHGTWDSENLFVMQAV